MTATSWLIGLPVAASPLIYLAGRVAVKANRPAFVMRWLAFGVLGYLWWALLSQSAGSILLGEVVFRVDAISTLLIAVVLTVVSAAAIFALAEMRGAPGEEKYYATLIMMTGSMLGLSCSADLFNLWVWFELLTVSSYALVMFRRGRSLEAGMKYLVQSVMGSAFILLGIALTLMQSGTLSLEQIGQTASDSGLLVAGALFVTGFGIKIAIYPLHTWLPDAHSQAPSSISAVLSGIVIEIALITMLRILAALSGVHAAWGTLLLGFAALNMLGGNLLAMRQTQIKRMLAYSSIAQIGYILLGFGTAIAAGQASGAQAGFFHLFTHGLAKSLAFLATGALLYALGRHTLTVSELSGACRRYPFASFVFSLALLSLAGLPPFAGFMSKWQIFAAGFGTRDLLINLLVIFGALMSILSLAYYLPLINIMYRQEMSAGIMNGRPLSFVMNASLFVLAIAIVVFGIFPHVINGLAGLAGDTFMAFFGG